MLSFCSISVGGGNRRPRFIVAMRREQNLSSGGLTHGYIAEKTSPGALASGPEGTEETSTLLGKYEFCKALCMTLKGNELALLNEAIKRMR
ncbi:MAG: hypothetical protein ACQEQO_02355 [Thermodesulfobacteriota bacterium]